MLTIFLDREIEKLESLKNDYTLSIQGEAKLSEFKEIKKKLKEMDVNNLHCPKCWSKVIISSIDSNYNKFNDCNDCGYNWVT